MAINKLAKKYALGAQIDEKLSKAKSNEIIDAINKLIGGTQSAITDPSGGATIDSQSRTAIIAILTALRAHGIIAT